MSTDPGRCRLTRPSAGETSDRGNVDKTLKPGKVGRVTRVEAGRMGVRSCGYQQVQDERSRLASYRGDRGSKLAIAGCDVIVDR